MDCYSVSPHDFYVFFMIFFKIIFVDFIFFNIELVENYNCSFSHKTLWIAVVFPYIDLFFSLRKLVAMPRCFFLIKKK